jgi:hypothetical protein
MHDFDRSQIGGAAMETYEYPGGGYGGGRTLNEQQEWELAGELLELGSEQEFEQFLGDLISTVGKAAGSFISSPVGKAVGGVLKSAAGKLLPMAGSAIGGYFGGPAGAQIGGQLASGAGSLFGLGEAESEEREWEAAQTFVRLATDTVKNAAQAAAQGGHPQAIAQQALAQAAQVHAPGLVPPPGPNGGPMGPGPMGPGPMGNGPMGPGPTGPMGGARSGRWIRRHGKIIVLGV